MQRSTGFALGVGATGVAVLTLLIASPSPQSTTSSLDKQLRSVLKAQGFTGTVDAQLEPRLGRPLNIPMANLGCQLWFDKFIGLHDDNSCGGCHSPTNGFGDSQSIAIGIDNNNFVGPSREGPRNMRRAPSIINVGFYPNLMWNSRFIALSGDPFNHNPGWQFPAPEGTSLSYLPQLIFAQAFIPPTEQSEMAGFLVDPDHDSIRAAVIARLNGSLPYVTVFNSVFGSGPITYNQVAKAIGEFQLVETFSNAPIDRFARGDAAAMTDDEKRGALLFFGTAKCIQCHAVSGQSNEMFSDFKDHVIGIPQITPSVTNVVFDGPNHDEDFGLEQITGLVADRYKFRTSPLRNSAVQAAFFHNGAFTNLDDAIRHHLNVIASATAYTPQSQHLPPDLSGPMGPLAPVLARVDPILTTPIVLSSAEFAQLSVFVMKGLMDRRASPVETAYIVPKKVLSGMTPMIFQFSQPQPGNPCDVRGQRRQLP